MTEPELEAMLSLFTLTPGRTLQTRISTKSPGFNPRLLILPCCCCRVLFSPSSLTNTSGCNANSTPSNVNASWILKVNNPVLNGFSDVVLCNEEVSRVDSTDVTSASYSSLSGLDAGLFRIREGTNGVTCGCSSMDVLGFGEIGGRCDSRVPLSLKKVNNNIRAQSKTDGMRSATLRNRA